MNEILQVLCKLSETEKIYLLLSKVSMIMSPVLIQSLVKNLSSPGNLLYSAARTLVRLIIEQLIGKINGKVNAIKKKSGKRKDLVYHGYSIDEIVIMAFSAGAGSDKLCNSLSRRRQAGVSP